MNLIKQKLINYLMDNPSLSEEVDYLPDSERHKIYTEQVNQLTDREALEEIHANMTGSEIMDFIEELMNDVENERQRGDEQFDRAEQLKNDIDALETVRAMQAELRDAMIRREMGIAIFEDIKALIDNFIEADI